MKLGDPNLLNAALDPTLSPQSNINYPPPGRLARQQSGLKLMQSAQFTFRTLEEAESLSVLLANCFPEPDRVINGLAELMINAVEHGNLGIGFEMKASLCEQGNWRTEINERLEHPAFKERSVDVTLARKDGGVYIVIADQGEGFDWQSFLKVDPAKAGIQSGRGIAMAGSVSFDKLTYNDKGNKAVAYVADSSALNW